MTDRKRRSDAFDADLTPEQRSRVYDLMKVSPWYDVADHCEKELGIRPGKTALYNFVRDMRESESERRIADALAHQAAIRRSVQQIGDMDAEMAAGWEQLALESSLNGDLESATKYLGLAEKLRARALERARLELKTEAAVLARESLDLEKQKFAELQRKNAEARKSLEAVVAKGGIDETTLRNIEEAINLL